MPEQKDQRQPTDPKASRPYMPGYGILDANAGRGLLPWSWASERLSNSHNYWVATTRPDGSPHVMLVWGLWLDGTFYFGTGRHSRKARNLAANPRCVVCTERAEEAVILEGVAEEVTDPSLRRQFVEVYEAKYNWDLSAYDKEPVYAIRPHAAFALIEKEFIGSATRWLFDAD